MAAKLSKCLLCGEEKQEGLVILDQVICQSCEQKLVAANCQDEAYENLLAGLCPLAKLILARAC